MVTLSSASDELGDPPPEPALTWGVRFEEGGAPLVVDDGDRTKYDAAVEADMLAAAAQASVGQLCAYLKTSKMIQECLYYYDVIFVLQRSQPKRADRYDHDL